MLFFRMSFSIKDDNDDFFKSGECPYEPLFKKNHSKKSLNLLDSPYLRPRDDPKEMPLPFELPPSVKFSSSCSSGDLGKE